MLTPTHVVQVGTAGAVSAIAGGVQVGSTQITFDANGVPTVS